MRNNIHQISLDEMFETYLNCGGEPTAEDLAAFTYDDETKLLDKATKEADLGQIICAMGKSVADRTGETILVQDISGARPRCSNQASDSRKRKHNDYEEYSEVRDDSKQNGSSTGRDTIAIYLNNERARTMLVIEPDDYEEWVGKMGEEKNENFEDRQNWVAHRSWSDIVAFFEAKVDPSFSAFEFAHRNTQFVCDDTDDGDTFLGQFLEHLAQILAHQHRTHLFAVYVLKNQARLVFADRSGTVVSEPFPYGTREHPTLHRFFWKLARMSDKERGFDETATPAPDDDISAMREYAVTLPTEYLKAQSCYALSWDPKLKEGKQPKAFEWPMHKLSVGNRAVFVGRPSFATHSLFGRCTRGYVAFEKLEKDGETSWELHFLKDSWRVKDANGRIRPEHEVYERLRQNGVDNRVPTCLAAGDVVGQNGSPQLTRLHNVGERRYHPRSHYRMLISEVYRPLSDFTDFRELSALLRDALQAHKDAWEKAGVLHRDVSFNNILIHEVVKGDKIVRKGILSDWDLSKYKEDMSGTEPRQPDRTGTWYFRSALLGRYPRKPYEVSDDVESFIHVYHYSVLRFHRTDMTATLKDDVATIYERAVVRLEDGAHLGSIVKFNNMRMAYSFITVKGNETLETVLDRLAELYSRHYATIDKKVYDRKYDPGVDTTPDENEDRDNADKTLHDHSELLSFFSKIRHKLQWKPRDLTKSQIDLFKVAGLVAPRGNNGFSFSMQNQGLSSQDATHVEKKRKANPGSALRSVDES